jgi:GT2 family glycosyltransferase
MTKTVLKMTKLIFNPMMRKGLSLIYSTRQPVPAYRDHLRQTAGVTKLEIICLDNPDGKSLAVVYNEALQRATYDTIVFLHDDLKMNTPNWGRKIIRHFEDTDFAILGLAGTTDLSEDGCWWSQRERMVGQVTHQQDGRQWLSKYSNDFGKSIIETVLVDGLFVAVDRNRLMTHWDERIPGFHFYDLAFCVANRIKGARIGVVFDVSVTHLSIGQTNDSWESNRAQFVSLYGECLPMRYQPAIAYDAKPIKLRDKKLPKVSVIIPTKENLELLSGCVESFLSRSQYPNYEIILADTGSSPETCVALAGRVAQWNKKMPVRLLTYDYYNFSTINNQVVREELDEDTELVLFCNNDIALINDVLSHMVKTYLDHAAHVGTVGARLHFSDASVQHSGIIGSIYQSEHLFQLGHHGFRSYHTYHPDIRCGVLGNTAALMLIQRSLFERIGGFDETFQEAFEDVILNFECIRLGKQNIFCGTAVAYHYESQTRGQNEAKAARERNDYVNRVLPYVMKHYDTLKTKLLFYP